ncbi:hypothetical protein [Paenibacillus puerhi]|uniref:hypothetical protein n=1 Tax=Paenibacillus puerhi TaxID=2692622 RepID=UPI00135BC292|nr:hypothetical protein [Paenibacillus puerhi]
MKTTDISLRIISYVGAVMLVAGIQYLILEEGVGFGYEQNGIVAALCVISSLMAIDRIARMIHDAQSRKKD